MKFACSKPIRRLLILLSFLLIIIILIIKLPQNQKYQQYNIEPNLQLQRFGLVSEDGIIEADKIEKIDNAQIELEKNQRKKLQKNQQTKNKLKKAERLQKVQQILREKENNNNDKLKANNDVRNKRRMDRYKKAQQRKKDALLRNRKKMINQNNLVSEGMVKSPNEKSNKIVNYSAMKIEDIDNYIKNNEPESDLDNMSLANKKLFLQKVNERKDELLSLAGEE